MALRRAEQWPPALLSIARCLEQIIRRDSDTDPIDTLSGALLRQVAEDLLSLAADVVVAFPRENPAGYKSKALIWGLVQPVPLAILGGQE